MRKLKLDVETLAVQSFQAEERPARRGTVFGGAFTEVVAVCGTDYACGNPSDWDTCGNTCQTCYEYTCYETCPDSCRTCVNATCEGTCVGATCEGAC